MLDDVSDLTQAVKKFHEDLGTISGTMQERTSKKLEENLRKLASGQKR